MSGGLWRPPARLTIPELLQDRADALGDKQAFHFDAESISYDELHRRTTAMANGLLDLGVGPGDHVAVLMRNSPELLYVWLATAKLGAVYVPINTAYTGAYLSHQLLVVNPAVLVVDQHLAGNGAAVLRDVPSIAHLVVKGDVSAAGTDPGIAVHPIDQLLSFDPDKLNAGYVPSWTDPNAVIFTAGTTGPSKGALMTQNYLVRAATQFNTMRDARESDVFYSPLPLFHLNAMLMSVLGPIAAGGTAALDEGFSVSGFWDRVRYYNATQISVLGPLILMLWNAPATQRDADNPVRILLGVPIPADLHRPIEERFEVRIVVGYGLSECVPVLVSSFDDPPPPGFSGKANPLFDVRLFTDDDEEVAVGEVGEIVCRPREPHIMSEGYVNDFEATTRMWRNLWFHTGDLGRADADGFIAFVDRKKDYLRRRGENISSFEVERAILTHPQVVEAAVFGVPSDVTEDEVMACVALTPDAALTLPELMEHCAANIPYFAVPRFLEFMPELPKNPIGRVRKFELKARGVTDTTWDRVAAGVEIKRQDRA